MLLNDDLNGHSPVWIPVIQTGWVTFQNCAVSLIRCYSQEQPRIPIKRQTFWEHVRGTLSVVNSPVNLLTFRGTDQQKSLLLHFLLCWFYFGHSEEKVLKYNKIANSFGEAKVISLVLGRACRDLGFFFFFHTVDLVFLSSVLPRELLTEWKTSHRQATILKKASISWAKISSWGSSLKAGRFHPTLGEREALSQGCLSESWHLSSERGSWSKTNPLVVPICCALIYIVVWMCWTCTGFISDKTELKCAVKGWPSNAPGANGHSVPGASPELVWNINSREHMASSSEDQIGLFADPPVPSTLE